jgi:hypothetical protein
MWRAYLNTQVLSPAALLICTGVCEFSVKRGVEDRIVRWCLSCSCEHLRDNKYKMGAAGFLAWINITVGTWVDNDHSWDGWTLQLVHGWMTKLGWVKFSGRKWVAGMTVSGMDEHYIWLVIWDG